MEPLFDLALTLPRRGSREILAALQRQLRSAILDGRLRPGLRLPATRALAANAGVSRNTALAAYDLLLAEGYIEARHGSGTFVAANLGRRSKAPAAAATLAHKLNPRWRHATVVSAPRVATRFDFRAGYPDQRLFPFDVWRRLMSRALAAAAKTSAAFGDPQGDPRLREAISRHVSSTRAVACEPDAVIVIVGAQGAFDLLARVLVCWRRPKTEPLMRVVPTQN